MNKIKTAYYTLIIIALMAITPSAIAQDPYTPASCGFNITFPADAYITDKCDESGKCYKVASFSKFFSMETSLRADVICNPITAETAKRYNSDVMVQTLEAMTDQQIITKHQTYASSEDNYRQATLIGQGLQGTTPTLYFAQLWIDNVSAFSVEAEIVGQASEDADKMLSDILRSIKHNDNHN